MEAINPIIRKITIGDLKQGLTYQVGQRMLGGSLRVTAIIQDEAAWYKHQLRRVRGKVNLKTKT
jgi:hypothetical protein